MAYNYPYFQPYQTIQPQIPPITPQPAQVQTQPTQVQNGGFISVRNEMEARNYPIAPGTSITFKDETAPYVYTKTMGFSQLDRPIFDKYKLVKEDIKEEAIEPVNDSLESVHEEIKALWKEIDALKEPKKTTAKKKEEVE